MSWQKQVSPSTSDMHDAAVISGGVRAWKWMIYLPSLVTFWMLHAAHSLDRTDVYMPQLTFVLAAIPMYLWVIVIWLSPILLAWGVCQLPARCTALRCAGALMGIGFVSFAVSNLLAYILTESDIGWSRLVGQGIGVAACIPLVLARPPLARIQPKHGKYTRLASPSRVGVNLAWHGVGMLFLLVFEVVRVAILQESDIAELMAVLQNYWFIQDFLSHLTVLCVVIPLICISRAAIRTAQRTIDACSRSATEHGLPFLEMTPELGAGTTPAPPFTPRSPEPPRQPQQPPPL